MLFNGVTLFSHNSAERDGGALYAVGTVINLQETINFTYLKGEAFMTVEFKMQFNTSFNTALGYGGGICHAENTAQINAVFAQGSSVASTLVTAITSPTASLKLLQNPQHLPGQCSNLTYNLFSTEESEVVILYPEGPCHDSGFARVVINLMLLSCPDGFILASNGQCV